MTENTQVEVAFGEDAAATAQNLLAAAERLGLEPWLVRTTSKGYFLVPQEVADEAESYSGVADDDEVEKALEDLKAADLDALAVAEGIDLTGAKKSNATKVERIREVRAERATANEQSEDDSDGADAEGEDDEDQE